MAKLTAAQRRALPARDFVYPTKRKYPIQDRSHAANAKSRASAQGGAVKKKVDTAVARRFPDMGHSGFRSAQLAIDARKKAR